MVLIIEPLVCSIPYGVPCFHLYASYLAVHHVSLIRVGESQECSSELYTNLNILYWLVITRRTLHNYTRSKATRIFSYFVGEINSYRSFMYLNTICVVSINQLYNHYVKDNIWTIKKHSTRLKPNSGLTIEVWYTQLYLC
jgi:hypothetical protein